MSITIDDLARIVFLAGEACLNDPDKRRCWESVNDDTANFTKRAVRFLLVHPDADEVALQEEGYRERLLDGWTYGPTLDPVNKKHPGMVTFGQLSTGGQASYRLMVAVVRALEHLVTNSEGSALQ